MAFTVTPTSGAVPFLYEAQFSNKFLINGNDYALSYRVQTTVGSCAPPADTGATQNNVAEALLKYGQYTQTMGTIPEGSCRTGTLVLKHVSSGVVVQMAAVNIDNL